MLLFACRLPRVHGIDYIGKVHAMSLGRVLLWWLFSQALVQLLKNANVPLGAANLFCKAMNGYILDDNKRIRYYDTTEKTVASALSLLGTNRLPCCCAVSAPRT